MKGGVVMYEIITNKFGYTFWNYEELKHFLLLNHTQMFLNGEYIRRIELPNITLTYSLGSAIKLSNMPTLYNI